MTVKANWHAKHGPVWGALNAALGAALFTLFTDLFGAPAWWGILVGAVVAACAYGAARHAKLHRQSAAWRAAAWLLVGFWTAWARVHEAVLVLPFVGPKSFWWADGTNWLLLFVMFLVAAIGGKWLTGRPEDPEAIRARETRKQQLALAQKYNNRGDTREDKLADEWELRFARVQKIGGAERVKVKDPADETGKTKIDLIDPRTNKPVIKVVDGIEIFYIEFWKNEDGTEAMTWNPRKKVWENDGFTFDGLFPEGGGSWRDIDGPRLANDARLPAGCTVRAAEGPDRGSFRCYVQLVNVLDKDRPYPTDFTPKSILDGMHIGYEEHGAPKVLDVAGHNTTNAGAPKSGKTNTANVAGMRLAETVDSLTFDYDIAGGGVSAPFFPEAWLNGDYQTAPQPGVAVAAPNVQIAWLLSTIGVRMIGGRKKGYQAIKKKGNVPVGHCLEKSCGCGGEGVPLIMHRVDEGWSLYKAGDVGRLVRANLEWIAGEGRPGAVRVFYGALGSTDEYIPNGVQNISPNRIALRQPNETEISRFLGWGKGFDADVFKKSGNAVVRDDQENIDVVKMLLLDDEDIIQEGVTKCSKHRPVLDSVTEAVANAPVLIEHPDLVAYFKGKIDVTENGRRAETDNHWIWDGTLTIKNFWRNRWAFILPEIFPERFPTLMQDSMAACGQTLAESTPAEPGTTAVAAGPTTGGTTMVNTGGESTAAALHKMKQSEQNMDEALAAGERAAQEADARYAARMEEVGAIDAALGGEGEQDGDPSRTSTSTLPTSAVIPDYVGQLPPNFQYHAPAGTAPAPRAPRASSAPMLADDPERQRILVLGFIVDTGSEGISVGPLRQMLIDAVTSSDGGEPYSISDQAFRKSRKDPLVTNKLIHQPYAAADEDLFAPDGGKRSHFVATDLGVRFWEKNRGKIGK